MLDAVASGDKHQKCMEVMLMSSEFVRKMRDVKDISKLPLTTNSEGDILIAHDMAYIRFKNSYVPIMNIGHISQQDEDKIKQYVQEEIKKAESETSAAELIQAERLKEDIYQTLDANLKNLKVNKDDMKKQIDEALNNYESKQDAEALKEELYKAIDDNNQSNSKKIDDVKDEISQMIEQQIQSNKKPLNITSVHMNFNQEDGYIDTEITGNMFNVDNPDDLKQIAELFEVKRYDRKDIGQTQYIERRETVDADKGNSQYSTIVLRTKLNKEFLNSIQDKGIEVILTQDNTIIHTELLDPLQKKITGVNMFYGGIQYVYVDIYAPIFRDDEKRYNSSIKVVDMDGNEVTNDGFIGFYHVDGQTIGAHFEKKLNDDFYAKVKGHSQKVQLKFGDDVIQQILLKMY